MTSVDLTKFMAEAKRMAKGEIAVDFGYLSELPEFEGDGPVDIQFDLSCPDCGTFPKWVDCPDCAQYAEPDPDCFICEGEGGFLECPNCVEDGGVLVV